MIYLLDTDHNTILQRGGAGYDELANRLAAIAPDDYGTSIVSYEEQCKGWTDKINRATSPHTRIDAYAQLQENLRFYRGIAVFEYTIQADAQYVALVKAKVRIGTKDLRIAAITLANHATLLTRNTRDFSRVPGLLFEDWTVV
jgi:tRNA(fMet)-specific endonuclease VapC